MFLDECTQVEGCFDTPQPFDLDADGDPGALAFAALAVTAVRLGQQRRVGADAGKAPVLKG
ncbi:hypothetical protein [Acidovorax sp. SDU_ACID1]|uniref:hypothetical protein n=1 Tax=Acidovorax sp. SDU_ACID1 TaxID=3136632 RepID=UPI003872D4C4